MREFKGAKGAVITGGKAVMILREDIPSIAYPGMWDFPGGGREGSETPIQCFLREVKEELGLSLDASCIVWQRTYPALDNPTLDSYFMVAIIPEELIEKIRFGDEGERWELMSFAEILSNQKVVPNKKVRFQDYLKSLPD